MRKERKVNHFTIDIRKAWTSFRIGSMNYDLWAFPGPCKNITLPCEGFRWAIINFIARYHKQLFVMHSQLCYKWWNKWRFSTYVCHKSCQNKKMKMKLISYCYSTKIIINERCFLFNKISPFFFICKNVLSRFSFFSLKLLCTRLGNLWSFLICLSYKPKFDPILSHSPPFVWGIG